MWGTRLIGWGEPVKPNAVGDDVDLFGGDTHLDERALGNRRGDGDGVGLGVDGFFAGEDVRLGERQWKAPACVLGVDDLVLEALVGRAAVAKKDAAVSLDLGAGEKARAGDGDEGVGIAARIAGNLVEGVAIEGQGVPGGEFGEQFGWGVPSASQEVLGGMEKREGADEGAGKSLAFKPSPGPCGVESLEMASAAELVGELEVVEDAEDGLHYLHALALRDFTSSAWSFSVWSE
jgi:hypothetical protein